MIPPQKATRGQKRSGAAADWTQLAMVTGKKQDAALIFKDNAAEFRRETSTKKRNHEQ